MGNKPGGQITCLACDNARDDESLCVAQDEICDDEVNGFQELNPKLQNLPPVLLADGSGAEIVGRRLRKAPPPLSDDCNVEIGPEEVDSKDLAATLEEALIVDIRSQDFAGGHIPGAVRAPLDVLLEDPEYLTGLLDNMAGRARIVFCCMHGETSRLCARRLSFECLNEKLESDVVGTSRPRVGFLVGGLCSWVNHFHLKGAEILRQHLEEFEPACWKAEAGLLVHVSASKPQDLLAAWRASSDLSKSIRKAKPLLIHSQTVTLQAAREVLTWQKRTLLVDWIMSPDDIDVDQEDILGAGSTSIVVKARQRSTGRALAAKVMKLDDPSQRKQLLNSLTVFVGMANEKSKLEGIMQLQGLLVDSQKVSLVFEFMDIGAVSNLLQLNRSLSSSGGLPEPLLQHVLRQPIRGLRYLHQRDLLHRDVKPENILTNSKGEVCLADFGLTKYLENDAGQLEVRRALSFVGTQGYLSPQRSQGNAYSVKEDVWAFGIVIYELATGEHPFKESSGSPAEFFGKLWEKMNEDVGESAGLALPAGGFSEELREVVVGCLRKRPSRRLSATELAACKFWNQMDAISSQGAWDNWLANVQVKKV